ncbi:hypothetical protein BFF78_36775 [Streptomyces fodineus]|uniref:Uncharacterized protein n=1 Tax=Streptomyces fodineus TaxID=1904616 RepID=A0A1D7YPW1_9ACTN|nr:hypothetical protein BFF78_36775 [Streptomyces fodineus]
MWPAWKVRERGGTTSWFQVRLAFPDGARVDALAVVHQGCVSIEDVRAEPALSLADLTGLADWIEGPLFDSCGVERPSRCGGEEPPEERHEPEAGGERAHVLCAGPRRARPVWPRGVEGRRLVAKEYRAAQEEGADPVLAVMSATGHSRRRSLRLIAQARDAGFLSPRHARRRLRRVPAA